MTSVEGAVMDSTTAPCRWLEPSAHHDVHVDHGKDVGDERSARDSDRPWGVCKKFEHKIPQKVHASHRYARKPLRVRTESREVVRQQKHAPRCRPDEDRLSERESLRPALATARFACSLKAILQAA